VPKRIFGPKREEVTESWRQLYEDCSGVYLSPNIIRVTKSMRIRWSVM